MLVDAITNCQSDLIARDVLFSLCIQLYSNFSLEQRVPNLDTRQTEVLFATSVHFLLGLHIFYVFIKRFLIFLPVHVEDEAQHGGWILPGREEHDMVAGKSNVIQYILLYYPHRLTDQQPIKSFHF